MVPLTFMDHDEQGFLQSVLFVVLDAPTVQCNPSAKVHWTVAYDTPCYLD